jgi:hypothetical protein
MKIVEVRLESTSPYSQSRMHDTPKLDRERPDDYEVRTWREKCTVDGDGVICIPAMALKQMLDASAKLLGIQIPGKGKSTFTKHFKAGVICEGDVPIGVRKEDVPSVTINANSTGERGSGKRVKRTFPIVSQWSGTARFAIFDETVTRDIFERHLTEAGRFVGIGRFRPENGGLYGRFKPTSFRWSELK